MQEKQIDMAGLKISKGIIQRNLNIIRVKRITPELCGDEDFRAGDTNFLYCIADELFGVVAGCRLDFFFLVLRNCGEGGKKHTYTLAVSTSLTPAFRASDTAPSCCSLS